MTSTILFVCHPDHGHVVPTLAMAAELVRRGHDVTYLTAPSMRDVVAGTGAAVATYESRYRDADFTELENDPGYLMSVLLDESEAILEAALADGSDSAGLGPVDCVVYDTSVLYAGRVLARVWDCEAVQTVPFFASNEKFSYLNAMYNDEGGQRPAEQRPTEMPEWVTTTMVRIGTLCARYGLDVAPHELWFEVPDRSVVTLPREFQYEGDSFDDRFVFTGPCIGDRGFLGEWEPPAGDTPIVLVSLGAVFNEHRDIFARCIDAFRGRDWHAVVTVADGIEPAELGELPPNVEVHRWVPHVAVLRHAALCVTHGGMGTVLEALSCGTPLVCVPTSALDRPTGWRIRDLGLGRLVDPERLDPATLAEAVEAVLSDPVAAATANRFRTVIAEAGGAERAADVIGGL
ncbi:macrolide family glycosyltransferase [Prauserella rugosa]|uniref:dTDP-L-oleandrosyltransferase n=1 Tax=Prauserella rugosa TaxID=43354 RepID=A0A660C9J3_9PSEU|nr:macrolide family glycosyltransferase [Prauserella rugosa]KID30426.1 glycosyltransferase, MGT family [Prauserella sp. Am3]KMS84043.1 glycosyl transferase [Streptomyces regensis]TWH20280.1 dTDP-L-oleandrosyltransferase [Prauserella rugosa]